MTDDRGDRVVLKVPRPELQNHAIKVRRANNSEHLHVNAPSRKREEQTLLEMCVQITNFFYHQ
jgi:hypothetical protein